VRLATLSDFWGFVSLTINAKAVALTVSIDEVFKDTVGEQDMAGSQGREAAFTTKLRARAMDGRDGLKCIFKDDKMMI
jgi:hypothetical protein